MCSINPVSGTVFLVTAKHNYEYFKLNQILTEGCVFKCAVTTAHMQPRHTKIGFVVPSSILFPLSLSCPNNKHKNKVQSSEES